MRDVGEDYRSRGICVHSVNVMNRALKVCYIYQDEYPWEVRTEKIVTALAKEGIEVHIICRSGNKTTRDEKLLDNMYIHRLPMGINKITQEVMNFPAFFSPFWIKEVIHVVQEYLLDLIIVRDLPLSPAAYIAGRTTRKPVIMDMAEDYPAMIRDTWRYRGPRPLDYIIRNPLLLRLLERLIVPLMDGVFVVSDFSQKRVETIVGRNENIWVVGNTPVVHEEKPLVMSSLAQEITSRADFVLLYIGGLEESRGLDTVIRAMESLIKAIPNILLVIVGTGTSQEKLRVLANQLLLEKHILFVGWRPHAEIPSIVNSSDVCLIPHYVTEHTNTTLPNKLFDYMAQKKPVIVTQAKALAEIVTKANCGLIYHDKSPMEFSQVVEKLQNPQLRETLGLNGWNAVQEEFNWDYDKARLLEALRSVCTR
jgi:glycosyltransferase involved in cell wall biosynthesis